MTIGLACLGAGLGAGAAGILWRSPAAPVAAPRSAVEQRRADDGAALAGIAAALALDPQDRGALAQLDSLLPQMFDAETGVPDGSWTRALREIPTLLKGSAHTREGQVRLGLVLLVVELYRAASGVLTQAARAGAPGAMLPLAVALLRSEQLEAVLALQPAAAGGPRAQAGLHDLQGRAAAGLRRYDLARQAFAAAIAADPGHADALLRWGLLELWQGNREAAARVLARAREVVPTAPATLRLGAEAAYAEGDFAASATLYAGLADRPGSEPNDPIPPRLGQIRALIWQGDVAAAEALLSGTPEPGAAIYRALAAYRARRFGEAAAQAMPLEREMAGWPALQLLLGAAMLQTGFPDLAADRLRRYLAAVPGNAAAARLLAVAVRRSAGADVMPEIADLEGAFGFSLPAAQGPTPP